METAAPPPPPTTHVPYADSVESSPRSGHTDSWDSPPSLSSDGAAKLRLMCSYGGHIVPRPHDKSLCYIGGTTRIVVVERHTSLSALCSKLSASLLHHRPFSLKYQLPNEDLDSLISVSTDDDLENMIDEYDRVLASSKPSRLRLFLFPPSSSDTASSIGSLLDDSKSDNWFVDALNGAGILPRGLSADSSSDVNCLLGLDDDDGGSAAASAGSKPIHLPDSPGKVSKLIGQEIHSVPDSPMMGTTSSFGSTSSASCLSNLPPIRVHADDGGARAQDLQSGLEEHFSQLNLGGVQGAMISPSVENPGRVFSDDERLDQGIPGIVRKPLQNIPQMQHKMNVVELPTDAVTRDYSNPSGVTSGYYQEPSIPFTVSERVSAAAVAGSVSDPKRDVPHHNYGIPIQVQDPGFVLPLQQHEQQQFVQAAPHYIHHQAAGPVPISSYYQMHPQQHSHLHQQQQQYPMYFLPVGQNQPYNLAIQSNLGDTPAIPSSKPVIVPSAYNEHLPVYPARSAPPPKPEVAANMYRGAAPTAQQPLQTAPQFIHVSNQQRQYMGYHQLHHPPQAAAEAPINLAYEFVDPLHAQLYRAQQKSTAVAPQYQTVSSGAMSTEIPLLPQTGVDASQRRIS